MSVILNIDTATGDASVSIAKDGEPIAIRVNGEQRDHAAWIQVAISELLKEAKLTMHDLQAVAVTEGPGSYTGLRVGMATAKGVCYALEIPLITVSTLKAMAYGAKLQWLPLTDTNVKRILLCPMIDARRMEVFTAVYDEDLNEVVSPKALILDAFSFEDVLHNELMICFGNGADKWKIISRKPNVRFIEEKLDIAKSLAKLASGLHLKGIFANLAYTEPVYIKEFYSYTKK